MFPKALCKKTGVFRSRNRVRRSTKILRLKTGHQASKAVNTLPQIKLRGVVNVLWPPVCKRVRAKQLEASTSKIKIERLTRGFRFREGIIRATKQSFGLKVQVIMTKKAPIKIIKRNERSRTEESGAKETVTKKSTQQTAREMVNTVSNWVNEFQQKRRAETTQAIKTLFPEPPQPSEA